MWIGHVHPVLGHFAFMSCHHQFKNRDCDKVFKNFVNHNGQVMNNWGMHCDMQA